MARVFDLYYAVAFCLFAFFIYKAVELGPYGAAILLGRCVRIFVAAAQGYV